MERGMRKPEESALKVPAFRWRSCDLAETIADPAVSRPSDLSELPEGEIVLERAENCFGSASHGVTLQLDGRIVYANPRMAELVGYGHPRRLIGRCALDFYCEEDLAAALARTRDAFFGRSGEPVRHGLRRVDGREIEVEAMCWLLSLSCMRGVVEIVRRVGGLRAARARR
jgi:PAS domain S-box-containing protein